MDRRGMQRLCIKALASGGRQLSPFVVEWDVAGRCLDPVRREIYARAGRGLTVRSSKGQTFDRVEDSFLTYGPGHPVLNDPTAASFFKDQYGPYSVFLTAKCRKCDVCLKERARMWAKRAIGEIKASSRTWFGTLTLSPQWHERFAAKARLDSERRRREVFEAMPLRDQMVARHREIAKELTLAIKRLRKAHSFRYLLVLEAHKSGLPHYHMLIHEIAVPVRKAQLEDMWPFGFGQWRLVHDEKAAWYTAKYLSKCATSRVRASLRYGGPAKSSVSTIAEGVIRKDDQQGGREPPLLQSEAQGELS